MKIKIPKSYQVQPLKPGEEAIERATCGDCGLSWDDCGLSWDDGRVTGRCPFEPFHKSAQPRPDRKAATWTKEEAAQLARELDAFSRQCAKAEYTDTTEVWPLLDAAQKLLRRIGK